MNIFQIIYPKLQETWCSRAIVTCNYNMLYIHLESLILFFVAKLSAISPCSVYTTSIRCIIQKTSIID